MEEEIVLCAANSYEQKYYLNPEIEMLPESIKQELNIMCVLYTEDVGGILMVFYDEDGNLEFRVDHEENDFSFDEIGSVLKIKQLQQTKQSCSSHWNCFIRCFIWEKRLIWKKSRVQILRKETRERVRV